MSSHFRTVQPMERPDAFSNIFFSMLKMAEKFQRWNFFDIFGGKIKIGFTGREEVKQS